jgi:hypothetical protein
MRVVCQSQPEPEWLTRRGARDVGDQLRFHRIHPLRAGTRRCRGRRRRRRANRRTGSRALFRLGESGLRQQPGHHRHDDGQQRGKQGTAPGARARGAAVSKGQVDGGHSGGILPFGACRTVVGRRAARACEPAEIGRAARA